MNSRTVERVESWGAVSVADGYRGLHALADDEFSGAAVADDTWLFMLNGRVVGVFQGDVEDFEDASFTAYEAPHLSLPLLFAMRETGGETQATYYTNDTPLSETDATLGDANFTGYVELSENVLSGDYYTVYYGGRSMSAAFVGSQEELLTGEEAFERADDEVGLYEVVSVDLEVTDVPEPAEAVEESEPEPEPTGADESADEAESDVDSGTEERETATDESSTVDAESADAAEPESDDETVSAESTVTEAEPTADRTPVAEAESDVKAVDDAPDDAEQASADAGEREAADAGEREAADAEPIGPSPERPGDEHVEQSPSARAVEKPEEGVFSEEAEWRETTTVPSLNPEESPESEEVAGASGGTGSDGATQQATRGQSQPTQQSAESPQPTSTDQVAALKEAVAEREDRIETLETRVQEAEAEAEELRAELEEVRTERDALREDVESLQADLEAAREGESSSEPEDRGPEDRTPAEALAGTNLFVRYASKADPTLDAVHGGDASRESVNANLRLEHHTQFDTEDATVDGEPFEAFLEDTAAYRFVSWLVREFPYELRETEHTSELADVFDAIPDVDRAELDGTVSVRDEDGEEQRASFDVVLRDRMGNPLLVAELNPERDPVTGDEMTDLVESAEFVASAQESLGGAFYVTASFFEPNALETAKDATGGGGFLSRSDKESYVKTARKSGFHLCLVEDRNETFHVTVPEL